MKNKTTTHKWWVDTLIFGGFLLTFFLDLTGVLLHQWLGLAICVLAVYHLLIHWSWVKAVVKGLFGGTSSQAKGYFILDLLLAIGFLTMLITGLVISTWFDLYLPNFFVWKNVHVMASIGSISVLLIKIGLHWKWIVNAARKVISQPAVERSTPVLQAMSSAEKTLDRREFLKVMAPITLVTAVAVTTAVKAISTGALSTLSGDTVLAAVNETQPVVQTTTSNPNGTQTSPTAVPTQITVQATSTPQASVACVYRCRKGNHCSYPGKCRDYQDANNNGLCDLGECL